LALQDGLSFVKLILSEKNKILVIPKGSFNQETVESGCLLSTETAVRRNIKLAEKIHLIMKF
jgi:HlyD family secretion protein